MEPAPSTPKQSQRRTGAARGSGAPAKKKARNENSQEPSSPVLRVEFRDQKKRHREYKIRRRDKEPCGGSYDSGGDDCAVCRLSENFEAVSSSTDDMKASPAAGQAVRDDIIRARKEP